MPRSRCPARNPLPAPFVSPPLPLPTHASKPAHPPTPRPLPAHSPPAPNQQSIPGGLVVRYITGRGLHSEGGAARIKPRVRRGGRAFWMLSAGRMQLNTGCPGICWRAGVLTPGCLFPHPAPPVPCTSACSPTRPTPPPIPTGHRAAGAAGGAVPRGAWLGRGHAAAGPGLSASRHRRRARAVERRWLAGSCFALCAAAAHLFPVPSLPHCCLFSVVPPRNQAAPNETQLSIAGDPAKSGTGSPGGRQRGEAASQQVPLRARAGPRPGSAHQAQQQQQVRVDASMCMGCICFRQQLPPDAIPASP